MSTRLSLKLSSDEVGKVLVIPTRMMIRLKGRSKVQIPEHLFETLSLLKQKYSAQLIAYQEDPGLEYGSKSMQISKAFWKVLEPFFQGYYIKHSKHVFSTKVNLDQISKDLAEQPLTFV